MALSFGNAETEVRVLTRHETDTVRLTQAQVRSFLLRKYRALRTWLYGIAPELYLVCSGEIAVAAGESVQLASSTSAYEHFHKCEWLVGDNDWEPFEGADSLYVNRHVGRRYTVRLEGQCLKFGPRNDFSGTVRVQYHATPPDLVLADDLFNIPVQLEQPLIFQTCGLVAVRDGDGAKGLDEWNAMADDLLLGKDRKSGPGSVAHELGRQLGVHPSRAGLQRVMGY